MPAKDVGSYIDALPTPKKEICMRLRSIIKTIPGISEEIKMGVPWFSDKFYIVSLKDHVNLGVCISGMNEKDLELLEGKGKFMRHMKFYKESDIDNEKIISLLRKTEAWCPKHA